MYNIQTVWVFYWQEITTSLSYQPVKWLKFSKLMGHRSKFLRVFDLPWHELIYQHALREYKQYKMETQKSKYRNIQNRGTILHHDIYIIILIISHSEKDYAC